MKFIRSLKQAFLKSKKLTLSGLDISSSALRFVELERDKSDYILVNYAIENLPMGAFTDGEIRNFDALSICLQRLLARVGKQKESLAIALPFSSIITNQVIVPNNLREDELEMHIEADAIQYLSTSLDEVNLDYQVEGPSPNNEHDLVVSFVAAKKETVEDYVALVESAGAKVVIVDVDLYAQQAALDLFMHPLITSTDTAKTVCNIHIGGYAAYFTFFHHKKNVYSRNSTFHSGLLTELLMQKYSINEERAIQLLLTRQWPNNIEQQVFEPYIEQLNHEIKRCLHIFYTATPYTSIDYLVLSGLGISIPNLEKCLFAKQQIQTLIANPFEKMKISQHVRGDRLVIDAPSLLVACGLALRRFDHDAF